MVYSRFQVERCLRYAFEYARNHGKKARGKGDENTLGLVGKTNVLTYVYDLWERAFYEVAEEYPDVKTDYCHVDATCMWMVKNPEWFDVLVTGNMFGDIITDLGAQLQGGLGVAASGNIHPGHSFSFQNFFTLDREYRVITYFTEIQNIRNGIRVDMEGGVIWRKTGSR